METAVKVKMEYGRGWIGIDGSIPGRAVILKKERREERSWEQAILHALEHPIGSPRLSQLLNPDDSVCVVISDITRCYQRPDLYLPYVIDEISRAGVPDGQITLLCAMGAHGFQSEEEKALLLGEKLRDRFSVVEHDCRNEEELVNLGTSPNGTLVCLNRRAVECDKLVLTGAIGYHDMAGYGGGRKSLLPGIASYEGVAANHLQVFSKERGKGLNLDCRLGNLKGNPMHEDMVFAGEQVKPDFLFNVVLDTEGECYRAVAGDWKGAFEAGTVYCDEACAIPIREKADVVIAGCGGYPKDMNLYQASKGYATSIEAVKPGGIVLLAAACEDAMGTEESVSIIRDVREHGEREDLMRRDFAPEAYSGYYICEQARHYRLMLVSDYEPADELEGSGLTVFRTMEDALEHIYAGCGRDDMLTYVIPHSMSILPKLEGSEANEG